MKISHRLNIAILAGSVAGIAVAIWIAISAISSAEQTKVEVDRAFDSLRYAVEFRNIMTEAHDNVERLMGMENVTKIDAYTAEHHRMSNLLDYVADEIENFAHSDELKAAVADLRMKRALWQRHANIVFGLEASSDVPTQEVMARHKSGLDEQMELVLRVSNLDATEASVHIKDQLIASLSVAGLIGAAIITGAALFGLATVRTVGSGLRSLGGDMERLAQGDMNIDASMSEREDEIGIMAKSVSYFRQALEERAALEERQEAEAETQRELAKQQSTVIDRLEKIVAAGVAGDFSASMDSTGLEGPQLQLADSVNTLLDAVGSGLAAISLVMSDLAVANLSSRMEGDFNGSFASLRDDVNKTCETLASLIHKVQAMVHNIDTGTQSLANNGSELTKRSADQTRSIDETSKTVDAMVARVAESTQMSKAAVNRANEAEKHADHGQSVVSQSVEAIREIEKSSQKITDIISVIESIAFQTNLLALNAAVEAARAGESGKGFAVVATEVRTLAQRTTEAANDISQLILDSSSKVEQGVVLAEAAGRALKDIKDSISTVSGDIHSISSENAQLSSEAKDVRAAMASLETLNMQSADIVSQSGETTSEFEQMTRELSSAVAKFQVEGGEPIVVERTA